MPIYSGGMGENREEIDRAMQAVRAKVPEPCCPMCKTTSWSVGTVTLQPVDAFPIRLVTMICGHCAFTAMHDLDVLGVK